MCECVCAHAQQLEISAFTCLTHLGPFVPSLYLGVTLSLAVLAQEYAGDDHKAVIYVDHAPARPRPLVHSYVGGITTRAADLDA